MSSKTAFVLLSAALGLGLSSPTANAAAAGDIPTGVEDAVNAGRNMPIPEFDEITKGADVNDFIASNTGSTAEMEALRQNGQGVLYDPGRNEADACRNRDDPKCLAVQMVDKGSANRPVLDPDEEDKILGGRNDVIDNADDWVDVGGNGSSAGNCEDHVTVIPKPEETMTCEVRTNREPGGSRQETCEKRFDEILSETSVWACENKMKEEKDAACSIPVVVRQETTTTLACLEGSKDATAETCPVTVTPGQKEKHYAACFKPVYRSVTKTCTRRLVVTAEASCRVGETQTASNSDFGGLGEDAVPGADTLTATSVCSADGLELRLTVNSQPEVTVTARTNIFETVVNITGGQARLAGDVSCTKADCIAQLKMTVYRSSGTSHVYQGEVFLRFPFVRFIKNAETDYWSETCTGV